MQVRPRGQNVYVKVQDAEEKTLGGILLPESAQQRPTSGQVISVGDGALGNGKQMDFTVKPGDEVRPVRTTDDNIPYQRRVSKGEDRIERYPCTYSTREYNDVCPLVSSCHGGWLEAPQHCLTCAVAEFPSLHRCRYARNVGSSDSCSERGRADSCNLCTDLDHLTKEPLRMQLACKLRTAACHKSTLFMSSIFPSNMHTFWQGVLMQIQAHEALWG
jgi:co-chaperonin GroES (HSP10)